jgi:hypothetical protein
MMELLTMEKGDSVAYNAQHYDRFAGARAMVDATGGSARSTGRTCAAGDRAHTG